MLHLLAIPFFLGISVVSDEEWDSYCLTSKLANEQPLVVTSAILETDRTFELTSWEEFGVDVSYRGNGTGSIFMPPYTGSEVIALEPPIVVTLTLTRRTDTLVSLDLMLGNATYSANVTVPADSMLTKYTCGSNSTKCNFSQPLLPVNWWHMCTAELAYACLTSPLDVGESFTTIATIDGPLEWKFDTRIDTEYFRFYVLDSNFANPVFVVTIGKYYDRDGGSNGLFYNIGEYPNRFSQSSVVNLTENLGWPISIKIMRTTTTLLDVELWFGEMSTDHLVTSVAIPETFTLDHIWCDTAKGDCEYSLPTKAPDAGGSCDVGTTTTTLASPATRRTCRKTRQRRAADVIHPVKP